MTHKSDPHQFRIVKLSDELQHEFGLPPLICADPDGLPFPEGQAFRAWLIDENACQPTTADKYLGNLLSFLTFLRLGSPSLHYTAPADHIRMRLRDYLREKLGCIVRPHRQGNFLVAASPPLSPSVRLHLVALRRFYTFAILRGYYMEMNPLLWSERLTRPEHQFTPSMPPLSGLTVPEKKPRRNPETYFCFVAGDWQPQIIDDPDLPKRVLAGFVYRRDQLIARILFQSGARVSEVLELQLGDWRRRGLHERALATNKGSRGERVKEIWWSGETAHLLRQYVETERRHCDPTGLGLDELSDAAPLFITEKGDTYTYAAFYYHWRRACMQAGIKVHPHQARHWFVTMGLHRIQAVPAQDQRDAARQALIAYMHWKNPETIQAYDHHLHQSEFSPIHAALIQLVESQVEATVREPTPSRTPPDGTAVSAELWQRLTQLLEPSAEG
jgi:integrase